MKAENDPAYKQHRKHLRTIIKETTGLSLQAFGEQYLDSQYMALSYRIRHGVLRLEEYHTICFYTGKTFEELWPNPHIHQPRKISLKLNHQTLPPQPLPAKYYFHQLEPVPLEVPQESYVTVSHKPPGDEGTQKKGEGNPRPAFVDPYEGMVPPEI